MAAPRGNKFWKIRSKHGRDRLFSSPEDMWKAATEYFEWCDKNPWKKIDYKGKDIVEVEIPTARPYTLTGLCLYLGCNAKYFNQFEDSLTDSEMDQDFSNIITRIRETIYTQKFEGAAVGAYNANIIARDLGLIDKTDITTGGEKIKTDEELMEEIERLKKVVDGDGDG